ncbi:hypothetical protein HAX54_011714 [Datura stramonium]|uniref:DYW domain-containing protein n=1 Tax=Datura stramonium TaxID=4076 RepID=A0ABS8RZ14_DATST|nr:hypothetical protein [Datura stramonium]
MLSAESAFVELGEGSETLKMECSCNKIFSSEKHQTASEHGGANQNDQENQEHPNIMGVHSECLAIAFALLNTEIGFDILVIKNLRMCIVNALVMIIGDW